MNPDLIYSQYRDDALAAQTTAKEYLTFVAMPFGDRFSYRSKQIYKEVIQAAAAKANELNQAPRRFAEPRRVDDGAGTAVVITEAIVKEILYSHLFVGDLTFANPGVLLEVGIAMGLKSNQQIILITQGELAEIHFDIRNNKILPYNSADAVTRIAQAMIEAAKSFEADADRRIESIKKVLTPEAVQVLRLYGIFQKANPASSLHSLIADRIFGTDKRAEDKFEQAARELLERRLLFTDYKSNVGNGADRFGMHATELGWVFIGRTWPDFAKGKTH